jgi:hypothetical protein
MSDATGVDTFDWKAAWYALDEDNRALSARLEAVEAKARESALSELSAIGQAMDAHEAQLAAERKLAQAVEALQRQAEAIDARIEMWGDDDMAALTRRLADTAIEQSELYQAAKRDAEEAEAYVAELEAKLKWVLEERDATFALMLKRAESAEAKLASVISAYRIEAMRRDDYSHEAFDQHIAELKK